MKFQNILIAGGSGMVGQHLTKVLKDKGYAVKWLSRNASPDHYVWNPAQFTIEPEAILWADAIINLAGAGIADERWSEARKKELINSRTQSTETLSNGIKKTGKTHIPYLAASAVGYYGNCGETRLTEESTPADCGFLVQCCQAWEQASAKIQAIGNPTTVLRIGIVLDRQRGALAEIIKPMRFGLGAWFGDGSMWMPWIHHLDLCNLFTWALEQEKTGVYNAVAPHPERNKQLTLVAKQAFHLWAILLPAPSLALRIALGEMSAVVLNSNRVSAEKAINAGFVFTYPDLSGALRNLAENH